MYQERKQETTDAEYERKLQLVRAVREENRMNLERVKRRSHLLYGDGQETTASVMRSQNTGYMDPDFGFRTYGDRSAGENGAFDESMEVRPIFFALRMIVAVICMLFFWAVREKKLPLPLHLEEKAIKETIAEDFSKQMVDYIEDFTYTLGYEKTSIE